MYQSFSSPTLSSTNGKRLPALRALIASAKLDGFLVPRADEHQGEYVPACAERLSWLTGFTGSAGLAVVLAKSAALFVDGRYTVQAPAQVDGDHFEILQVPAAKLSEWLIAKHPKGGTIGFDPQLHTISWIEALHKALSGKNITLKPIARNLVDRAWGSARPAAPEAPAFIHPLSVAGTSAPDKITTVQNELKSSGQYAVILTQPDSLCWLLNIRGADVAHNPVALAFAIVPLKGKVELFISATKIHTELRAYLKPFCKILPPTQLDDRVRALKEAGRIVRLDPATTSWSFYRSLGGGLGKTAKLVARAQDPCALPKAIKNPTEIKGARKAHIRDGVAICNFLAWLDDAPIGGMEGIDEIIAAQRLEDERAKTKKLRDISFDTISAAGPHGAIVHYRVDEASNRKLKNGELFLIDSGGQYRDGTTDITRTIAIGKPTAEMRRCYSGVLKGHIAIATAKFPSGTRGIDLDPFARRALWDMGLDFDHGTGHGVGSYLSVHEGPQSISRAGMTELKPGMIISNEPGYYKEGAFGIRLENLVLVNKEVTMRGGDRAMMSFTDLTLAPFDTRLIDARALSRTELQWLNTYHATVRKTLTPLLDKPTAKWLANATRAI